MKVLQKIFTQIAGYRLHAASLLAAPALMASQNWDDQ
jgi:hypothetical protein